VADDLIQISSGQWVIAADDTLTPRAQREGSIVIETEIRDLPAVRALRPGDIVLDIGGYVGDTCALFQSLGCEVWAFEPYPDAFECMRRNCPGAHLVNAAVGDGRPVQAGGVFGNETSNYAMRMVSPGGTPSLRIDDLNLSRVDFVKMDIEGFEPAALDGMTRTIERFKPPMLIEVYNCLLTKHSFTRDDVLDRLRAHGYSWRVVGDERESRCDLMCVAK